jgi:RNA polymerase sigma factor (TIGR02999 family)
MDASLDPRRHVTGLLTALGEAGTLDAEAREDLAAQVYGELKQMAVGLMAAERGDHTLQPTALVHEAWLRLVDAERVRWEGRAHFFGIAARCMRRVLVDHARSRAAAKRGGGRHRVTLDEGHLVAEDAEIELLSLDQALAKLAELDARAAQVAEMRLFAGMTVPEVAVELGVSPRTVDGDWATARLWLRREMGGG